ncbi:hypothetical protein GEMRC1_012957 [Eukaryota sp. GEM-RC1]
MYVTSKAIPFKFKFWFKKLSELLAVELLFVKDGTFRQDLLSVEFHQSSDSAFAELKTLIQEKKWALRQNSSESNEQNVPCNDSDSEVDDD